MTPSSNSVWGDHKSTLDGCSGPSPCQRSSSPPPAAYAPARGKRKTKSFTDWQLQYPSTFGDLSAGRAPACRNPVTGRPPLSKRLHRLIVLLPIPPPPYPPTVPPLPLRILSSQMPPTPLACRPSPPLPSTDLGLAAGQPWDRVWQTCPRAASLSHVCHLLCPELPLGPLR